MTAHVRLLACVVFGSIQLAPFVSSAQTCSRNCVESLCGGAVWYIANSCNTALYAETWGASQYSDGVEAHSTSGSGVYGYSVNENGVWGYSDSPYASGAYGENYSSGYGLAGRTSPSGIAVLGDNSDNAGFAGYFTGQVYFAGYLAKAGGGFEIDHPGDPENMRLIHSFTESPEMKNLYDGVVVLGTSGKAVIVLPPYFEALNESYRYQLSTLGEYAPVYVSKEVSNGSFEIAGGKNGTKVSWQVTGVRRDRWALRNRQGPEQMKDGTEAGRYLNPEAFGLPDEFRLWRRPEALRSMALSKALSQPSRGQDPNKLLCAVSDTPTRSRQ